MAQNWFKHDYGARNDEKILEIRAEYGWKGYGLFFGLIETMCEQETGAIDLDRIGGLCVAYGLPKDELLAFIDYCLEVGLFFEDEDGLIKNDRVINHLDHMNTLKEAGRKGANKRWKGNNNRGANGGANAAPNADKIREDKIREDKPYTEDFEQFWELYDLKKGKKKAWLEWKKLSDEEKDQIFENVPVFLTHFSSKQYTPRPRKYLYNRYWEDEGYQQPETKSTNGQRKENRAERYWRIGEELFDESSAGDPRGN